ncbi:MAG: CHAT domain-containing protein [Spirosomataceae bacterium]
MTVVKTETAVEKNKHPSRQRRIALPGIQTLRFAEGLVSGKGLFRGLVSRVVSLLWFVFPSQARAQTASQVYKRKADSCFLQGNLNEASQWYRRVLEVHTRQKNYPEMAFALTDLAAVEFTEGNSVSAISRSRKALSLLPQFKNDTIDFRIKSFLSIFYDAVYRRDSAEYFAEQADRLIDKSKVVQTREEALYHFLDRGLRALHQNDFKLADVYFQKTLALSRIDATFDLGVLYNNMALSLSYQKKYAESLKYYRLALQNRINVDAERVWLNLAECCLALHDLPAAEKSIHTARKRYSERTAGGKNKLNPRFEQRYWRTWGLYHQTAGKYAEALGDFQKSLAISRKINPKGAETSEMWQQIAQHYIALHQVRKALGFYQSALIAAHETFTAADIYQNPNLDRLLTERELFRALTGKANAFRQLYTQTHQRKDIEAALRTHQLAIQLAEKMRRSYQSAGAKLFFTENYYAVYEQAVQTAQELYQLTQKPEYQNLIFDFYEKSRAASLADIIRDADLKPKTINAALLAQEKGLYQQITGLQAAIKRSDSTTAVKVKAQLVDKEIELDRLTKRFERDFPAYYQLKYDIQTPATATIQQQLLSPDAALIQYFLTDSQLYTLILTREQSKVLVQPVDSTFRQSISKFRVLLSVNPGSKVYDGNAYSSTLYSKLITPVLPFISNKKRLLIVRDAELNYLPFEVLAAKSDDYLFKKYAISYAYSIGILMNKPTQSSSNVRLAIAPFAGNIPQKIAFRGAPLVPLPASVEEVRQIGGDVYVEKEATKKRFLEQYREHGIIHFATHALTDDKDPMRSFVAFYPDGQEYRLFTNELYDLDLKEAQLVVLSACETGAGKLQRGEGVMSLARAFAYAGAQSVATTLWNANDEATAYISTHFHEYINDGLPLDEALQRAKLDFLQSDLGRRYDHPYYWANLVLIGCTDPIPREVSFWWWVVGGIVLVLGIEEWLKHRKTTQKSQSR